MADGLGSVQRHRGCRSRHAARAERLSLPGTFIHHLRGGACQVRIVARQRTRWIKGYMQTWLVPMRQPANLGRELGPAGFLGFQVMVGGTVLTALVHPWFYALAAFDLTTPSSPDRRCWGSRSGSSPLSVLGRAISPRWRSGSWRSSAAAGRQLLKQVPLMPLYWLLISGAAYRAIWQFATDRFAWEKTEHGVSVGMRRAKPES
jgi:glycosyltransferase XagB